MQVFDSLLDSDVVSKRLNTIISATHGDVLGDLKTVIYQTLLGASFDDLRHKLTARAYAELRTPVIMNGAPHAPPQPAQHCPSIPKHSQRPPLPLPLPLLPPPSLPPPHLCLQMQTLSQIGCDGRVVEWAPAVMGSWSGDPIQKACVAASEEIIRTGCTGFFATDDSNGDGQQGEDGFFLHTTDGSAHFVLEIAQKLQHSGWAADGQENADLTLEHLSMVTFFTRKLTIVSATRPPPLAARPRHRSLHRAASLAALAAALLSYPIL